MGEKHYVYSARTTEDGLTVLNKTKGGRSWDIFINEAVAEHYGLDLNIISLPPSKFLQERAERKAAKEAEKAAKKAKREADTKVKAEKADAKAKKAGSGKKAKAKVEKAAKRAAKEVAGPQPV